MHIYDLVFTDASIDQHGRLAYEGIRAEDQNASVCLE